MEADKLQKKSGALRVGKALKGERSRYGREGTRREAKRKKNSQAWRAY